MIPLSDQNLLRGLIRHWLRLYGSKMLVETGRKLGCRVFDSLRIGGLHLFYQAPGSSFRGSAVPAYRLGNDSLWWHNPLMGFGLLLRKHP